MLEKAGYGVYRKKKRRIIKRIKNDGVEKPSLTFDFDKKENEYGADKS